MQELVLVLSSLAGIATAAAVRGRSGKKITTIGASPRIKSQIGALIIEKDILTKTIARLYQSDSDLTKIQKDRLLSKYQHQLGVVLAKTDKLKEAGRHPDLGPVGDGLITLMDQRLSRLDERLYEISSRITVKEPEKAKPAERRAKKPEPVEIPAGPRQAFEITTLTNIPKTDARPDPGPVQGKVQTVLEPVQIVKKPIPVQRPVHITPHTTHTTEPPVHITPQTTHTTEPPAHTAEDLPEDDNLELEKIKRSITSVLSKLDQAEVE